MRIPSTCIATPSNWWRFAGQPVSGIWKDVVVVPAWSQVEIDVHANQPGLSLFHCHHQFHMDMGFMTMMRYG